MNESNLIDTFGVWKHNRNILLVYPKDQQVSMSNSKGEVFRLTSRDWLEQWASIQDVGWVQYSKTLGKVYRRVGKTRLVSFTSKGVTLITELGTMKTTYEGWENLKAAWITDGWSQV